MNTSASNSLLVPLTIFSIFLFFLQPFFLYSQPDPPGIQWGNVFGSTMDLPSDIIATSNGEYLMTGTSFGLPFAIRIDGNGNVISGWSVNLNLDPGTFVLDFNQALETSSGYIFIGTLSLDGAQSNLNTYMVKVDKNTGNKIWDTRLYSFDTKEYGIGMVEDQQGNIWGGGTMTTNNQAMLFVTDSQTGGIVNNNRIKMSDPDFHWGEKILRILRSSDNFYYLVGETTLDTTENGANCNSCSCPYESESRDVWICKMDFDFNIQWSKVIKGWSSSSFYGQDILIDAALSQDGEPILLGLSECSSTPLNNYRRKGFWVVKVNPASGELVWEEVLDGIRLSSECVEYNGLEVNCANEILIAGGNKNTFTEEEEIRMVKLDQCGDEVWSTPFSIAGGAGVLDMAAKTLTTNQDGSYTLLARTDKPNGKYWIVKTQQDVICGSSQSPACPYPTVKELTVCDIGGPIFTRGTRYGRVLEPHEIALPSIRKASCITDIYPNGLPDTIYADYYVYKGDAISLSVGARPPGSPAKMGIMTFICDERCDEPTNSVNCEYFCSAGGQNPFLLSSSGLTYIAVVSDRPTDYGFGDGSLNNICRITSPIVELDCCFQTIQDTLNPDFARLGLSNYSRCYSGDRFYFGPENVYEFNITEPSLVSFSLEALGNQEHKLGMFMFNYQCGFSCLNYYEIPDNERTGAIRKMALSPGIHYLLVDTDLPVGTNPPFITYTLRYESEPDTNNLAYQIPDPQDCPVLPDNVHTLLIDGSALDLDRGDRLGFYYQKDNQLQGITAQRYWDGSATSVSLFMDDPANPEKCSYEPNDTFIIKVTKAEDLTVWKVAATFDQNQQQFFIPGAESFISDMAIDFTFDNSKLYHSPGGLLIVSSASSGINFTVLTANGNAWQIDNTLDNWINVPNKYYSPSTFPDNFDVTITANPLDQSRTEIIRFIGADGSLRTTTVIQRPTGNGIPISLTAEPFDINCFGDADGSISLNISGGTAPYLYEWSNGKETAVIDQLPVGNYSVTVTDVLGLSASASASISEPPALLIDSISGQGISAVGINDGMATVYPSGGIAPYSYEWDNGATTQTISALPPRLYFVTVTDSYGCGIQSNVMVPGINCNLNGQVATTDVSCFDEASGQASVAPSGGENPYTYIWSNGVSGSNQISGLTAGTYTVTVTDELNCSTTFTINIFQPDEISISFDSEGVSAIGASDGMTTATASGGTPPYTYSWSNNGTTPNITGLVAGTYTLTITDANDCTEQGSTIISSVSCAGFDSDIQKEDISCFGAMDGSVWVSPSGGVSPYAYSWSTLQTSSMISGLPAGNFTVTITDAQNCPIIRNVLVLEPDELRIEQTIITNTSGGNDNGAIEIDIEGGTPPYRIKWVLAGDTLALSGTTISQLAAGNYIAIITDENGCSTTSEIEVESSTSISSTPALFPAVRVIPNPTSRMSMVFIESPIQTRKFELIIYNILGQQIDVDITEIQVKKQYQLDFHNIHSGLYLLTILTDQQQTTKRILLDR